MKDQPDVAICNGCYPPVASAIAQFLSRWGPYSAVAPTRPQLHQLMRELIDPAITAYLATLPPAYQSYVLGNESQPGVGNVAQLLGFENTRKVQKERLRQFLKLEDRQSEQDRQFIATLESLMNVLWGCALKGIERSRLRGSPLNGERRQGFCRFCGSPTELTVFASGSDEPKRDDPDDKLRLSDKYCEKHRPRLANGFWNPAYQLARRSKAQFDLELARLSKQSAKASQPRANSGDALVDSYYLAFVAQHGLQPYHKGELRDFARLMVDTKLTDRKKQLLVLQRSGFNQSEIARKLGLTRQAIFKTLASIPDTLRLDPVLPAPCQPK